MECIRTIELEELLKNYNIMAAMVQKLNFQLNEISSMPKDELIESMMFKRKMDGLPFRKGTASDKTCRIALNINSERKEAMQEICKDLILLNNVFEKLRISFTSLNAWEREVITKKYFEGSTWQQIIKYTGKSEQTVKRYRDKAFEKIKIITRITLNDYLKLQKILDLDKECFYGKEIR